MGLADSAVLTGRRRFLLAAVLILLVLVEALHVSGGRTGDATARPLPVDDLWVPTRPPSGVGTWRFFRLDRGQPVGFDPCRDIPYVIHLGSGPATREALVHRAVRLLSAATGLRFRFVGSTDGVPHRDHRPGAGDPLWLGWADADQTDLWPSPDVIGLGGSDVVVNEHGTEVRVGGYAVVRPEPVRVSGEAADRHDMLVLLHELGHAVGLDHADDPEEVMSSSLAVSAPAAKRTTDPPSYGPGDRQGLWLLGSQRGCAT